MPLLIPRLLHHNHDEKRLEEEPWEGRFRNGVRGVKWFAEVGSMMKDVYVVRFWHTGV